MSQLTICTNEPSIKWNHIIFLIDKVNFLNSQNSIVTEEFLF